MLWHRYLGKMPFFPGRRCIIPNWITEVPCFVIRSICHISLSTFLTSGVACGASQASTETTTEPKKTLLQKEDPESLCYIQGFFGRRPLRVYGPDKGSVTPQSCMRAGEGEASGAEVARQMGYGVGRTVRGQMW